MITKAGSRILSLRVFGSTRYDIPISTIYDITGSGNEAVYSHNSFDAMANTYSDNMSGRNGGIIAFVGIGDTAPTADDYFLDDVDVGGVDVNTIVQCTSVRSSGLITPKGISYLFTFMNTGESAVTIKEICIVYRLNQNEKYMIARKVIPPRAIQSNETVTFSYEIDWF